MDILIEDSQIECKKGLNVDFEKEVIAFLNSKTGGTIYIGVNDQGEVVGVKDIDNIQLQIKDRIKNNICPTTLGLYDISVEDKNNKKLIKVQVFHGPEYPYYLRKKGMTPEGCYIRVGSAKEPMSEKMIYKTFSKRVRNSLKELESPNQKLTFKQLRIYYVEQGIDLGDNYLENLGLLTSEGKYNYNAFLLADENTVPIPIVKYYDNTKLEIVENEDFGNRCLITCAHMILDKLKSENKTFSKIEYYGRKEQKMFDMGAVKEAVINALVHNDYSYNGSPIIDIYADRLEITSTGGYHQS